MDNPQLIKCPERVINNKKNISTFINLLVTNLINKRKSKVSAVTDVYKLMAEIKKLNNSPVEVLNRFLKRAVLRFALRDYVTGSKKNLLPKPISKKRARLAFIKRLVSEVESRPENLFYTKFILELKDFRAKKGFSYNNKAESYAIAKQNLRQGRFVYGRAKLKKNITNASEKNPIDFM